MLYPESEALQRGSGWTLGGVQKQVSHLSTNNLQGWAPGGGVALIHAKCHPSLPQLFWNFVKGKTRIQGSVKKETMKRTTG